MTTTEDVQRRRSMPIAGTAVLIIGLGLMAGLSWRAAGHLPDTVTFVGTGRNGADQHAPRAFVLTAMPVLTLIIAGALLLAQRVRHGVASTLKVPVWRDARTHRRSVDLGLGVLVPVFLAFHLLILRAAEGHAGSGLGYVAAAVALVIVIVGNVWPKQAPAVPEAIGAKLDPHVQQGLDRGLEAQRRNLRPAGIAVMLLGLVALAISWLAPAVSLGISLLGVLVLGGVLIGTTLRSATDTRRR